MDRLLQFVVVCLVVASRASAQTPESSQLLQQPPAAVHAPAKNEHRIYFPGSLWTSTGNPSPSEKDMVTSNHLEQGMAYRGVEVYGAFTGLFDTKRLDWNRRTIEGIGVRYTLNVSHGIVRASAAYLSENRYLVPRTFSGPSIAIESWLGWGSRK